MRLNSKGQVTIPAELRHRYDLREGDEVEVVEVDGTLCVRHHRETGTRGQRITEPWRCRAVAP